MRKAMSNISILVIMLVISACSTSGTLKKGSVSGGVQYFVDAKAPDASDDNPGTDSKPWKSLSKAGKILKAGDKLTIKPGTYYDYLKLENSGEEGKPIIVEASSLGDVIISGGEPVKNWKRSAKDSTVWEADYNYKLRVYPPRGSKYFGKFFVGSEPADLAMNGIPLFWNDGKTLLPGCWTVDYKAKKIYTRLPDEADPNKRPMEIISKNYGIRVVGDHVILRNLIVRRFVFGFWIIGKKNVLENNITEWNAYDGVWIGKYAVGLKSTNNIIRWNGMLGTRTSPAGILANNKILFNNWKLNAPGWHSAGQKAGSLLEGIMEGNESAYNGGLGLWIDHGNNLLVRNNIVHDNTAMGLEQEAGYKGSWTGNVVYRNRVGFVNYSSSNTILKNNIFSDNNVGVQYKFRRTRVPSFDPKKIKSMVERYEKNHSKEIASEWLWKHFNYGFPCCHFRNNLTENNLLLNNGINFIDVPREEITDPKEKWFISGNSFKNNILVSPKEKNMVAGYTSLAQFQEKRKDGEQCLSFPTLETADLPEWAKNLYEKHKAALNYPHSYQSLRRTIYNDLRVRNGWCGYEHHHSPSALLALARICESKRLKEIKFSDPELKGYYIDYKNKTTLVLWRKHGRPADFAPVILKGVPKDAILETSWSESIPFQRKNDLVSITVGTWPFYIVGVDEKISEAPPFTLKMPEKLKFGEPMEVVLENPIGDGILHIDKYQGVDNCPDKLRVNGKTNFSITLSEDARENFVEFRIAGDLGGLYAGRMIRMFTGKLKSGSSRILKTKGFAPVSLASIANCSLNGDSDEISLMQMGKTKSLANLPEKIHLGNIAFTIGKDPKACVGFNSIHVKGKARPDVVTLDFGGKKIKALAFLQVCAWAPKKTGAPLLKYSLKYDDNLGSTSYVKNGVNILDWWFALDGTRKRILRSNSTWKAWTGDCGDAHKVNLYAYVWENPRPDVGVTSLRISTADPDKKVLMGLIAVSALGKKKK